MPDIRMTRGHWLREATRRLVAVRFSGVRSAAESAFRSDGGIGLDSPRLSAELLLCHVQGISRVDLAAHPERRITGEQLSRLEGLLRRRAEGEPVAYLLGEREFFGRAFRVSPATLVPRPETELLTELALRFFSSGSTGTRFADLGTGSGCIAVTLCAERPGWTGIATDLSLRALKVARHNASRHGVSPRLLFAQNDFLSPCLCPASLDLVVSNPPYVSLAEYAGLSPEIRDFEPVGALVPSFVDDGGKRHAHGSNTGSEVEITGLEHVKAVARAARTALKGDGLLLVEHGHEQGETIKLWLESHRWINVEIFRDLSGRNRVTAARRPMSESHTVS